MTGRVAWVGDGRIAELILSNPPRNALTEAMLEQVERALTEIESEGERVRALVVRGDETVFSGGADIARVAAQGPAAARNLALRGQRVLNRLEQLSIPTIAAIEGDCFGGGLELALACHLRIASRRVQFALPEITLGIVPALGGTARLAQLVGRARAREIVLTGRRVRASEAAELGLVHELVEPGDAIARARKLARRIAAKPPAAVSAVLHCFATQDVTEARRRELDAIEKLIDSSGAAQRIDALTAPAVGAGARRA